MQALLQTLLRWIGKHLAAFVVLIALLILGNWLRGEVAAWQASSIEAQTLGDIGKRIAVYRGSLENEALGRIRSAQEASVETLRARVATLDERLAGTEPDMAEPRWASALAAVATGELEELVRRRLERTVLEWERQVTAQLLDAMERNNTWQIAVAKLRQLQEERLALAERLNAATAARQSLIDAHPVRAFGLGFPEYAEHVRLRRQEKQSREALRGIDTKIAQQAQQTTRLAPPENQLEGPALVSAVYPLLSMRLDETMGDVRQAIGQRQERIAGNWINRLDRPVREMAPIAAGILALLVALPALAKLLCFYILAPLASRQPPVRILSDNGISTSLRKHLFAEDSGAMPAASRLSAVSLPVKIGPDDDLLVHPDALQSAGIPGERQTKWILDRRFPLSSLAAGLVGLTRVRLASPGVVIVTARDDPLNEVAAIPLPAGTAMVVHPRSVTGVVHRRGQPVRITRHWRLHSLHAWLTLQLRYLVFHGEATLLVQGCRGVRVECAASGRTIRQAATLAFDARACYATHRCETFWAYFSGQRELLNDSFSGKESVFAYQEAVSCARGSATGRWRLGGFGDAVLRAFGV